MRSPSIGCSRFVPCVRDGKECGYAFYTFYDGELDTTEHIIALYQRSRATTRWRIVVERTGSPHELIG